MTDIQYTLILRSNLIKTMSDNPFFHDNYWTISDKQHKSIGQLPEEYQYPQ